MRNVISRLWKDDGGALIATEWVFVATILVIGVIVGLVSVRNAVNSELQEFANAITGLCQNFSFAGQSNCCTGAWTCGGSAEGDQPSSSQIFSINNAPQNIIESSPCQ